MKNVRITEIERYIEGIRYVRIEIGEAQYLIGENGELLNWKYTVQSWSIEKSKNYIEYGKKIKVNKKSYHIKLHKLMMDCFELTKAHDIKKADKDAIRLYEETNRRIELLEDVIGEKLTTTEFKELAEKLNFRNKKRELVKNPKKEIEELGYKIENKRNKNERFVIISK